jgi:hypothetical protein
VANFNLKDTLLKLTRPLPAAASSSVTSAASLDLGHGTFGNPLFKGELLLTAPALTTVMLPDTRTMTYDIIESANADLSSPVVIAPGVVVQTGAGAAGAAAVTFRFKPSSAARRYYGVKVTSGASTTDSSAVSATLELVF